MLSALREHETAWVNIDEPKIGGLHDTDYVTAPLADLRLHGRNTRSGSTRRTVTNDTTSNVPSDVFTKA